MAATKSLGVVLGAIVLSVGSLAGQEVIENWPAPRYWSPRAPMTVPSSDGLVVPLEAEVIPSPPLPFVAINPCRIADTRGNGFTSQAGPPALSVGVTRTFQVAGMVGGVTTQCGIPPSAQAVSFQFTVTGMNQNGNLIAWPEGVPPTTSVVNWNASSVAIGSGTVVGLSATGGLNVQLNGTAGATTQLIIDVNGYYGGSVVTSVAAGTGLTGGGTGAVTVGIAAGGVGSTELAMGAVTSTKIGANAVTAGAIATGQVVKSLNGLTDTVSLVGSGGTTVTPGAGTITINSAAGGGAPAGTFVLGHSGDATIIGAGYTEVGPSNVEVWSATATSGAPAGRLRHTAVWTGTRMIVWGGTPDVMSLLNTGGQYDPVTDSWSATTTTNAPTARDSHTAVWTGARMVVWGGSGPGVLNTGGRYDPVGNSWTATTTTGAPIARSLHTAVWTGSRMIVWGGQDGLTPYANTGGRYDPVADSWLPTTTTNAPSGRQDHTAVWTGTKMIVWGGHDGTYLSTGGQYDPADSWTATAPAGFGGQEARRYHTAVWTGSRMVVWGGDNGTTPYLNGGGLYDPAGNSWGIVATTGAPTGRRLHSAVWTGSRMIVWGGTVHLQGSVNSGGQYDPANGSWAGGGTNTIGSPADRQRHSAIWTGTQMIVWGGEKPLGSGLITGGRYTILSLYRKN